jgi:hypothetical protein
MIELTNPNLGALTEEAILIEKSTDHLETSSILQCLGNPQKHAPLSFSFSLLLSFNLERNAMRYVIV